MLRRYPSSSGCLVSKETVGSPKFVSYPSMHMPRSRIPVVSLSLAFCAFGTAAFHVRPRVGFLRFRELSYRTTICNYFRIQCRGLRTRFPSASHTPSQGSHFGSATRLLAMLWLGGIFTRWATSTDFNAYRHLPTFHISLGTRLTRMGCDPHSLRDHVAAANPTQLPNHSSRFSQGSTLSS